MELKYYNKSTIPQIAFFFKKNFRIITTTTTTNQNKMALKIDLHLSNLSGRLFEVLCSRVHAAVGTTVTMFDSLIMHPIKQQPQTTHLLFPFDYQTYKPFYIYFLNAK